MAVEIISVGSEYILQHYRTNDAAIIANHLLEKGIEVDYVSSVVAQESRLEEVLRQAIGRSSLVFVISGVSSGEYDVSKKLLTRVLKKRLVLSYRILDKIKAEYESRGETMPRTEEKQALVPTEAEILENERGDAPGFLFSQEDSHVVLLPGSALELETMLVKHVLPRLDAKTFRSEMAGVLVLKTCSLPTHLIKERLRNIARDIRYQTLNYVTDCEETSIIVTIRSDLPGDVQAHLDAAEFQIREKLGKYVYGKGSQTLEEVVGLLLQEQKKTLAVAESCTGGLIAHRLTNVPGSSDYFERGVVAYSNEAKISQLDVSPDLIEKHGAVSAETAMAMAEGVRWVAQTSFGLAVTGIAGPSGGTAEKPVGLVYIGLSSGESGTLWRKFHFSGDRLTIKTRTAQTALDMLRQQLSKT